MNALELAEEFELPYWDDRTPHGQLAKAAAMLRKQDAAIKQLREALERIEGSSMSMYATYSDAFKDQKIYAYKALAATEEFK